MDNTYKKAMDAVCDRNFKLTGEEMLERAKTASIKKNVTLTGSRKRKMIGKFVGMAAACLILLGTSVSVMGYGLLGEYFRKYFHIDEGYVYELNQTATDRIFSVNLIGITGDKQEKKLLFDVMIDDETLVKNNDRIRVYYNMMEKEEYYRYNNALMYGITDGERDPKVRNLYHFCTSAPINDSREQEVVVDIKKISFEKDPERNMGIYGVNIKFQFSLPKGFLKDVHKFEYKGIIFKDRGMEYEIIYARFGAYESFFWIKYEPSDVKPDEYWDAFGPMFVLNVDGTEYKPQVGYGFESVKDSDDYVTRLWLSFPSVDYVAAKNITLSAGDQTYFIKKYSVDTK